MKIGLATVLVLLAATSQVTAADEPSPPELAECSAECKASMAQMVITLINDLGGVAFDESRLHGDRDQTVRTLARTLPQLGVTQVIATGHTGNFCTRAGNRGPALAPDELHARKCSFMTEEYALALGERMARSLAQLVTEATGGKVRVKSISYGQERPRVSYPEVDAATAGQWNEAASQNNRVELRLE